MSARNSDFTGLGGRGFLKDIDVFFPAGNATDGWVALLAQGFPL